MIYLGTSSWHFDGWRDTFYPQGLSSDQYLRFYAQQFRAVEVNTTFYALPKPATLIKWIEDVPAGFRFCLKFPRAISHEKRLHDCEAETLQFLDTMRALGETAGPAFLQLPPSLSRAIGGATIARYLDWLAEVRDEVQIAVEVRAPDLKTERFAAYLAERDLSMVLSVVDNGPDLFDIWLSTRQTVDFAFVRWIGNTRTGPSGDRELQQLRDEELDLWAKRIGCLAEAGLDLYGFMHNPYEGHSPASVRRLVDRLPKRLELPKWPPDSSDELSIQMSLL